MSCFTPISCKIFFIHNIFFFLQPLVIAIYFILVIDITTHCWSLNCHEIAPFTKRRKYRDKNFLESTSFVIFSSMYTCNIGLSQLKHTHVLEMPMRYLRVYFTIIQCSLPRLEKNWLIILTAWVILVLYKSWHTSNY